MKKFKTYLKESLGAVSKLSWKDGGQKAGTALLLVPKRDFDKDPDSSSLKILKTRVNLARALTKLSVDRHPVTVTGGEKEGEYYLVTVEFSTQRLQQEETKNGPPTNAELTKKRQEGEKEDLKRRQENEAEKAREQDFRKKEADRRKQIQQKDAQARSKKLGEVLEVGTDQTTSTFKKFVPGQ